MRRAHHISMLLGIALMTGGCESVPWGAVVPPDPDVPATEDVQARVQVTARDKVRTPTAESSA